MTSMIDNKGTDMLFMALFKREWTQINEYIKFPIFIYSSYIL
ncbi:MAG: hypothetical protein ACREV6_07765 [Clostridium sp.]